MLFFYFWRNRLLTIVQAEVTCLLSLLPGRTPCTRKTPRKNLFHWPLSYQKYYLWNRAIILCVLFQVLMCPLEARQWLLPLNRQCQAEQPPFPCQRRWFPSGFWLQWNFSNNRRRYRECMDVSFLACAQVLQNCINIGSSNESLV